MEDIALELEERKDIGKAVKYLRREGSVPAVIHDHGKASVIVKGPYAKMLKVCQLAGKHHPIYLNIGAKHYTALIKNIDVDPKKHLLRHVVFNAVSATEKVDAQIPVQARFDEGNDLTPAERNGLIVLHNIDNVEVEAIATKLPEYLEFNGEMLIEVGDHVTVADIIVPDGVEIKTDLAQTLATVFEPSALQAANDAAGGTAAEETAVETTDTETNVEEKETAAEDK